MLLTIGLIMSVWGIWLFKTSPVGKYERPKPDLGGIKATLKATPENPSKDFSDWSWHIYKERNAKY